MAAYELGARRVLAKGDVIPDIIFAKEFVVVGAEGKAGVTLEKMPDGSGVVSTYDGKGNRLVAITATKDGEGAIGTFDTLDSGRTSTCGGASYTRSRNAA